MAGWNSFLMKGTVSENRQRDERREEKTKIKFFRTKFF
jgi:hypothetical protein